MLINFSKICVIDFLPMLNPVINYSRTFPKRTINVFNEKVRMSPVEFFPPRAPCQPFRAALPHLNPS